MINERSTDLIKEEVWSVFPHSSWTSVDPVSDKPDNAVNAIYGVNLERKIKVIFDTDSSTGK